MYEINWEDVKNTAIELEDDLEEFTPEQRSLVLNMANRRVPESKFRKDTFDARRYYACHIASLMISPAAGEGTTSSESIDSFSVSKTMPVNNPQADKTILETQYGRNYNALLMANFVPFYAG